MRNIFPSRNKSQLSGPILSIPILSFTESQMAQMLDQAEPIITKWDVDTSSFAKFTSLFYENCREANDFVSQVHQLHKAMHTLLAENSGSEMLVRAQVLVEIAMKRLQKEFYQFLSTNRAYLDPESDDSNRSSVRSSQASTSTSDSGTDSEDEIHAADKAITEVESASMVAITNLKLIAECMISTGYGKECVDIYKAMRKSIVDEGLLKLGIEKESSSKIYKLDWEFLDLKINNWLKAVNVAVNNLFKRERILCDQVFAVSDSIRVLCFNEITKEGANLLFSFPENVVKSNKRSPEKIFRLLDMYTAIATNWPEIESIFSAESSSAVVNLALSSSIKLSDSVRRELAGFELFVQKYSLKIPATGAGVHNLTTEVMNYLSLLADYNVLEYVLFDCQPPAAKSSLPEYFLDTFNQDESPGPAVSQQFAWLILVLLCKLDGESRLYKNVSQSYLFLANNLQHIISQVRTSNLKYFLGNEWIAKHEAKVNKFAENYKRLRWNGLIESVPAVNQMSGNSPENVKESVRIFNAVFEEVHQKHSELIVLDSKLRDEMKVSNGKSLLHCTESSKIRT